MLKCEDGATVRGGDETFDPPSAKWRSTRSSTAAQRRPIRGLPPPPPSFSEWLGLPPRPPPAPPPAPAAHPYPSASAFAIWCHQTEAARRREAASGSGSYYTHYHAGPHSPAVAEAAPADPENYGSGQAQCVYVDVAAEANLKEVATDLRRHGPQLLLVRCSGTAQRAELQKKLGQPATAESSVGQESRGDGGQGRAEQRFLCDAGQVGPFLLAGRAGYVQDVHVHQLLKYDGVGQVAIGQFGLAVALQQMTSIQVALVSLASPEVPNGSAVADDWEKVIDAVARKAVRFVAGNFGNQLDVFLEAFRTSLQVRACASVQYDARAQPHQATALCIVGPVGNVKVLLGSDGASRPLTITRGDGELEEADETLIEHIKGKVLERPFHDRGRLDRSRGWPTIQSSKEKKCQHTCEHTKKISIYFGSNASRRTSEKLAQREESRKHRAERWEEKTGKQAWMGGWQ